MLDQVSVGFGFARHFAAAVMDSGWRIAPLSVVSMVNGVLMGSTGP